eukprot:TRINITY_DN2262_c0_g1_i1.p1 TRINITY_DN2262_c0_g1~~TRINITY_DN2262_c0_g1_i1.p1  ORF type:complete len:405 (-),score=98.86 TRINITY_DN2262_c0_g1_i1:98-1273(-)
MPELPAVEKWRKKFHDNAVGKKIVDVETQQDTKLYKNVAHDAFGSEITGKTITDTGRKGKHMWFDTDDDTCFVALHFGMTGKLKYKSEEESDEVIEQEYGKNEEKQWPPNNYKFILKLEGGEEIAYTTVRRLGQIRLFNTHPLENKPISEQGFDPYQEELDPEKIHDTIKGRRIPIKNLLLDQTVFAGVGNWIADETLYRSQIHPHRYTHTITVEESASICQNLSAIIKMATETHRSQFPKNMLLFQRERTGENKTSMEVDGMPIEFDKISSRTCVFCPSLQKLDPVSQAHIDDLQKKKDEKAAKLKEEKQLKKEKRKKRKKKEKERKRRKRKRKRRSSKKEKRSRKRKRRVVTSSETSSSDPPPKRRKKSRQVQVEESSSSSSYQPVRRR